MGMPRNCVMQWCLEASWLSVRLQLYEEFNVIDDECQLCGEKQDTDANLTIKTGDLNTPKGKVKYCLVCPAV